MRYAEKIKRYAGCVRAGGCAFERGSGARILFRSDQRLAEEGHGFRVSSEFNKTFTSAHGVQIIRFGLRGIRAHCRTTEIYRRQQGPRTRQARIIYSRPIERRNRTVDIVLRERDLGEVKERQRVLRIKLHDRVETLLGISRLSGFVFGDATVV